MQSANELSNADFDVIVVGYGFAGANAAIAAHDAGARVLVLEKMPDPGGISICSAGGIRVAADADAAFAYLQATNADTAPDAVIRALANGMTDVQSYLEELASACGATVIYKQAPGLYPFPGQDTFGFAMVESVPDFDPVAAYPYATALGAGALVFKVLQDNIASRNIEVRLSTPVARLRTDTQGRVIGVQTHSGTCLTARRGVVLACGGFEADPSMQAQYWQGKPVVSCAYAGNTGDGIRMAQAAGADLWHMWHYHGTYGFRVDGYPFGVRTKRLPDWYPRTDGGEPGFDSSIFNSGKAVKMPWILLDQDGQRFMNEYEPYMQDTGHRHLDSFKPETQSYPRIPAWLIADEQGRQLFPWGQPLYNDREVQLEWSADNSAEVAAGIIGRADSLDELARAIAVDVNQLHQQIQRWNGYCANEQDADFGRPRSSMLPISTAPFYYAQMWPIVSNTQGGPVHDARQRVLNPFGEPIAGLFAAGELGSVFGHLYLSGGNVSECFIGGRQAGLEAADGMLASP